MAISFTSFNKNNLSQVIEDSANVLKLRPGYLLIVDKDNNVLNVDTMPGDLLVDSNGQLLVTDYNNPDTNIGYASADTAGIIKIGDGLRINSNGVASIHNVLRLVSETTQSIDSKIIFRQVPSMDGTPIKDSDLVNKSYVDTATGKYRLVEPVKGTFQLQKFNGDSWISAGQVVLNIVNGYGYGVNDPLATREFVNYKINENKIVPVDALKYKLINDILSLVLQINSTDKILSNNYAGLKANLLFTYDERNREILILGRDNQVISKISTDSFTTSELNSVSLSLGTPEDPHQKLIFTSVAPNGTETTKECDVTALYNIYTSGSSDNDKVKIQIQDYLISAGLNYVDASDVVIGEDKRLNDVLPNDLSSTDPLVKKSYVDDSVSDIATGDNNGQIKYKKLGSNEYTNVDIKGLGSAAFTPIEDYATSDQGNLADAAIQRIENGIDGNFVTTTIGNKTKVGGNKGYKQSIGVSVTTQSLDSASSESDGLATANDVKEFVIDKIQSTSANFRGSWDTWNDVPSNPELYPADYSGNHIPGTNDYMVVLDASDYSVEEGSEKLRGTWRFRYTGSWDVDGKNGWKDEYRINEEPLTPPELAALNSGITANKLNEITTSISNITDSLSSKVDIESNPVRIGTDTSLGNSTNGVVLGVSAKISGSADKSVVIGASSTVSASGAIAIGNTATALSQGAVQLGYGTNNISNSLQFRSWQLLNSNGKIPDDRLNDTIARRSDIQVFTGIRNSNESDSDAIIRILNGTNPVKGNILIIKTVITSNSDEYKGFVFDGTNWNPLSDKYDWSNVIITDNIIMAGNYTQIGNLTKGSNETKTLDTKGKSVKQFLINIFTTALTPSKTNPSISLSIYVGSTSITAEKLYEVGTTITITYNSTFNPGSYTYGPSTGVVVTNDPVTDKPWVVYLYNGSSILYQIPGIPSGHFDPVKLSDNYSMRVRSLCSYSDGVYAYDNLGNITNVKIDAGTANRYSAYIKSFRKSFWGAKTAQVSSSDLTSAFIRRLGDGSNKALVDNDSFTISIPAGTKSVIFAYPYSLDEVSKVMDAATGYDVVGAFSNNKLEVDVDGAAESGDQFMKYYVYFTNFANATTVDNSYTVTI